jgi:hypothetical protein
VTIWAEASRACSKCQEVKPHAAFSKSRNPSVWCRACCRKNAASWRSRHRERVLETDRQRSAERLKSPEQRRWMFDYRMLTKYGLTREMYDDLVLKHEGRCAFCGSTNDDLVVDHCHDTGRVRGLLCQRHNKALGALGDTEQAVRDLLAYILG